MNIDNTRQLQLDRESRGTRYYRNAVERHWDPFDVDLEGDRERLVEYLRGVEEPEQYLSVMRMGVARFGAGEQAVTEDLAPLAPNRATPIRIASKYRSAFSTFCRYSTSRSRSPSRSTSKGSQWRSTAFR